MNAIDSAKPIDSAYPIDGSAVVVPSPDDVEVGIVYDSANLPVAGDVRAGVVYG